MRDLWSKRKGRDSNPRYRVAVFRFSRPVDSTTLAPFRVVDLHNQYNNSSDELQPTRFSHYLVSHQHTPSSAIQTQSPLLCQAKWDSVNSSELACGALGHTTCLQFGNPSPLRSKIRSYERKRASILSHPSGTALHFQPSFSIIVLWPPFGEMQEWLSAGG